MTRPHSARRPDILICSGLDPSGGAGFLADARVVHELGGRPVGVITALTVQNTLGMRECHEVDAEVIGEQLNVLLTDVEVDAIKLGLLGSEAVVRVLADNLALTRAPVIWDPVVAPTRGSISFLRIVETALEQLRGHLTLITPNRQELAALTGISNGRDSLPTIEQAVAVAESLSTSHEVSVLVKAGHFDGDQAMDVLVHEGKVEYLHGPRIDTEDVHGTGCALSSAIATLLTRGASIPETCRAAKQFVAERIAHAARPGRGAPAVV